MTKTYVPTGEWRTNALSNVPGGSIVSIQFGSDLDGGAYTVHYNNIKNPEAYINRIANTSEKEISAIWVDEKLIWKKQ